MKELKDILEFPCSVERLENGNTLIADAGSESGLGSEIIEVNQAGKIVWSSQQNYKFAHTAKRLANGNTVVADTSNNRIVEVTPDDIIVMTSDDWNGNGTLSDGSKLYYPNNIYVMTDGKYMITNRNADNFIITDRDGNLSFTSNGDFKHPHNCEPLVNGNYILADSDENCVREIKASGETVWKYDVDLEWPRDANLLENGNVLIGDSKNNRVIEVSREGEIIWEFKLDYFANIYEIQRLKNGNTLISDQQHHRVIEVNMASEIVWEFSNFKKDVPLFDKLSNGYFKKLNENKFPEDWNLATRFSEGGGKFIWGENAYGKPVPGLEYDRIGALSLQQSINVKSGENYTLGIRMATEDLDGMACIQVAFKDKFDGLLCDVTKAPKGEIFAGNTDWTQDTLDVEVPENAASADIRIFISGKGKVFFNEVRFSKKISL